MIKHICKHYLNTQYIPDKLRQLASRMYCYVCGNIIEKMNKKDAETPKYLGGFGRGNGGEHE